MGVRRRTHERSYVSPCISCVSCTFAAVFVCLSLGMLFISAPHGRPVPLLCGERAGENREEFVVNDERMQYTHLAYGLSHQVPGSDLLELTGSRMFRPTKYEGAPILVEASSSPGESVNLVLRTDEVMLSYADSVGGGREECLAFIGTASRPVPGRRTRRFRCRVELFMDGKGRLYRSTPQG